MDVVSGDLLGMLVFTPQPVRDDRGFFTRTFDAATARRNGLPPESLVQDSQSRSTRGVLRGLHFRNDGGEGKLVRCSRGRVFDVAVDLRPWSPTFRRWQSVVLDDVDHRSVWLPAGLAHGFLVLSDDADICYRIDREYLPGTSAVVRWDDPDLDVDWPLDEAGVTMPLTSPADAGAPSFARVAPRLDELFPEPGP
jgi:dTDP-4-dehydrorhamnose 3,5-epimerase